VRISRFCVPCEKYTSFTVEVSPVTHWAVVALKYDPPVTLPFGLTGPVLA
jgi:hypothetical protein